MGLPDGNGLQLLNDLGADRSIVITANPDPEHFEQRGVRQFLTKPLDLPQLAELVSDVASRAAVA